MVSARRLNRLGCWEHFSSVARGAYDDGEDVALAAAAVVGFAVAAGAGLVLAAGAGAALAGAAWRGMGWGDYHQRTRIRLVCRT
jgi:hypothetical protein